jgi:hypothetical protein
MKKNAASAVGRLSTCRRIIIAIARENRPASRDALCPQRSATIPVGASITKLVR